MKRKALFLFIAFLSSIASAESNDFKFVYHGLNFYIPDAPKSAGFLGTESDTIIFKYGDNPGEKLIGFSVENKMETGGCEPVPFFNEVLGKENTGCDELAVQSFRHVFVEDREAGVWSSKSRDFYYFISDKKSTIFFASGTPETKIIKVDSNFLTRKQIKQVFKEYVE